MQLIEDLRAEHQLIERVAGAFRTFVETRLAGQGAPSDGPRFMAFFRRYAGDFHHDKEEQVLFRALAERAEVPAHRGPLAALTAEHARMAGLLDGLEGLVGTALIEQADRERLRALAVDYSRSLWRHIDAENSVLFPEGEERLRRVHVRELPSRPMTEAEADARATGLALTETYPPLHDAEVLRGDGCMLCPSFGTACEGLEREWWTDLDWEDMQARMTGE
ncbi:hemerythrin domain-containing protein [Geothrix sp. 21YS21S-4]|uniref:hemerythrin domain-containing protein n=1 Tax=Geothrix sp. 21YS21S-4 TaxID=3068889 RepID=UPI0027B97705|nr:hemerythrin domain-containing protein [Geothrix sp. 21YS21S-4]